MRYLFWHNIKYDIRIIFRINWKSISESLDSEFVISEHTNISHHQIRNWRFIIFHYYIFFAKLNLICSWYWEVHVSFQIKKWKIWEIYVRTTLLMIFHWFEQMKFYRGYVEKNNSISKIWFSKFELYRSSSIEKNGNKSTSFFVIKYRFCFISQCFL